MNQAMKQASTRHRAAFRGGELMHVLENMTEVMCHRRKGCTEVAREGDPNGKRSLDDTLRLLHGKRWRSLNQRSRHDLGAINICRVMVTKLEEQARPADVKPEKRKTTRKRSQKILA